MKIVLLEPLAVSDELIKELSAPWVAAGHTFQAYSTKDTSTEEIHRRCADADIVIEGNQPLPREALLGMKNLKYLSVGFSGIDHVDAPTAKEMGITVSNSAGYADDSVAELVVCMTLSLLRNVIPVDAVCKAGGTKDGLVGNELLGKTVGIIGMGACGCRLAEILKVFRCNILFNSPDPTERALSLGTPATLDEIFSQCDIISLHCPLDDSTRGLVNAELIGKMKPTALLINCARGPIVDSQALADALNEGRIAGAGVDVYEMEPPVPTDHPLLNAKHIITTPHVAFASKESMVKRAKIAFGNVDAYLAGTPRNVKIG